MIFIPLNIYDEDLGIYQMTEFSILSITSLAPAVRGDVDKGTHIVGTDNVLYISNEPIDEIMMKINSKKDDLVANFIAHIMVPKVKVPRRKKK